MKVAVVLAFLLISSCSPRPEPILDQATVVARNASLRMKNSSTSRTLKVLDMGDKVDVLERHDNWYRVRFGDDIEGWMEESTVVTNATRNRLQALVSASENQKPQNTAVLREDANFRIEPGRSTDIIRKLHSGSKVEIIDRVTAARPGSNSAWDVWVKVRPSPAEAGWIYGGLIDFDIPQEIAEYSEGYTYSAVKAINQVQDSLAGPMNWYLVGEHRNGMDPHLDFDGIRVFTWDGKNHRYGTAFRAKNLRGIYPLEVGQGNTGATFRVYELGADGSQKTHRDYVMYGVVVREQNASPAGRGRRK